MSIQVPGVTGRLVGDPELRYTAAGLAVVKFVVATDAPRRKRDSAGSGETSLWRCTAWSELAVNIAESLRRGQRVFVQGRLDDRSWTDSAGTTRRSVELVVEDCGPSLRFSQAKVSTAVHGERRAGETQGPWAV